MTEGASDAASASIAAAIAGARSRELRRMLWWVAWCLPTTAVAVLTHELGHLLFMKWFGFPGTRLHFASATNDLEPLVQSAIRQGDMARAASMGPLWHFALSAAAGPFISYVMIAACAILVWRGTVHPFVVSLGLISTLRFSLGFVILYSHLVARQQFYSGTDEGMVAGTSGVSENLLWVIGLALVIAAWVVIVRELPRGERLKDFALTVIGTVAGFVLYAMVIGPRLLP